MKTTFAQTSFLVMASFMLLAASPETSTPATVAAPTPPSSSVIQGDEPVDVSADEANIDEATHVLVLTGNVVARQGPVELMADTVRVHYLDGATAQSTLDGVIEKLEAEGHVTVKRPGEIITSQTATYLMREKRIVMIGQVTARRIGNVIRGERLVIDLAQETVALQSGSKNSRVKAIFSPPHSIKTLGSGQFSCCPFTQY